MKRLSAVAIAACLAVPLCARANPRVYVFRSTEDASHPPDPAICANAPFAVNVMLGATLWSVRTRRRNGRVVDDDARQVGTATACVQLTNFLFPAGLDQDFYVQFDTRAGRFIAQGTCKLISNDTPEPFIVLAGCSLKIVSAPPGIVGGSITSNSVFNPLGKAGYSTGSYWTVLAYDDGTSSDGGHDGDER